MPNNYGRGNERIYFNIIERVGVIAQYPTGWSREVNIVGWNGNPPKLDIRDWDPDHMNMRKGLTFPENEAFSLARILEKRFPASAQPAGRQPGQPMMQDAGAYADMQPVHQMPAGRYQGPAMYNPHGGGQSRQSDRTQETYGHRNQNNEGQGSFMVPPDYDNDMRSDFGSGFIDESQEFGRPDGADVLFEYDEPAGVVQCCEQNEDAGGAAEYKEADADDDQKETEYDAEAC